jgi:hypothetical protein
MRRRTLSAASRLSDAEVANVLYADAVSLDAVGYPLLKVLA